MKQEDKQLLLKDLCARLPYGVKGAYVLNGTIYSEYPELIENIDLEDEKIWTDNTVQGYYIEDEDFKPYLRPMSSMTEIEHMELKAIYDNGSNGLFDEYSHIDYLNAHHFDYRGLIKKSLAIEAPEGMYNETVGVKKSPLKTFPRVNEFNTGASYRR